MNYRSVLRLTACLVLSGTIDLAVSAQQHEVFDDASMTVAPSSLLRSLAPSAARSLRSTTGTGPRLLGVDNIPHNLVEISTTTGNGIVVGLVDDDVIGGVAYDANHDVLYGTSTRNDVLVTIDPETGETTVVGPLGVSLMHGLAYDSHDDVLYGITNQISTQSLYRIDVETGAAVLVGAHERSGLSGLAFDPGSGVMFASEAFERALYTIDLSDGSVAFVGPFGAGTQLGVGLGFHGVLGLYACDNLASPTNDQLYSVDPHTGAVTLVGPINTGNVLGLGFETRLLLSATGTCPGQIDLSITGATPMGRVGLVVSQDLGSVFVPLDFCAGVRFGLEEPHLLAVVSADDQGVAAFGGTVMAQACGLFVQAVDVTSCEASNVISLP